MKYRAFFLCLLATLLVAPTAVGASDDGPRFDWEAAEAYEAEVNQYLPISEQGFVAAAPDDMYGWEPFGILAGGSQLRRHSLKGTTDVWEVWVCNVPGGTEPLSPLTIAGDMNDIITPYYTALSEGAYTVSFVAGGSVAAANSSGACVNEAKNASGGSANGAMVVSDAQQNFGLGSPGLLCPQGGPCPAVSQFFPANSRWIFLGPESVQLMAPWPGALHNVVAHELGHGLNWAHSQSGTVSGPYDNPLDVMSSNSTTGAATFPTPFATIGINRYAAGWIDPSDVLEFNWGVQSANVMAFGSDETEMVFIPSDTQGHFWTMDARVSSTEDPINAEAEGLTLHYIASEPSGFGLNQLNLQEPVSPHAWDHVIAVGEFADVVPGTRIYNKAFIAGAGSAGGYEAKLVAFDDIAGTGFNDDIFWLADQGITLGCSATSYCPGDLVTRAQMAAFLARALDLPPPPPGVNTFTDDDGTGWDPFIEQLFAAGITNGCTATEFCPFDLITRGQMAAFLSRALPLPDPPPGTDTFIDDDGFFFEADVERIAAAGITLGCTPSAYCPFDNVQRNHMAAFLHRSETWLP